ncbi:MAG: DUF1659 domain-containing protein [Acetobacterium sp.]
MAVVSDFLSSKMLTRLNYGLVNGKEVIKSKSYSNVKQDATIASILTVGTAITGLQEPTLEEVHLVQEDLIYDDGL